MIILQLPSQYLPYTARASRNGSLEAWTSSPSGPSFPFLPPLPPVDLQLKRRGGGRHRHQPPALRLESDRSASGIAPPRDPHRFRSGPTGEHPLRTKRPEGNLQPARRLTERGSPTASIGTVLDSRADPSKKNHILRE